MNYMGFYYPLMLEENELLFGMLVICRQKYHVLLTATAERAVNFTTGEEKNHYSPTFFAFLLQFFFLKEVAPF